MKRSLMKKSLIAALALVLGTGVITPAKSEAFDFLSGAAAVFSSVAAYQQVEKQVSYIENDGRDDYYNQMTEKYGVCEDEDANAMLESIMTRLTPVIANYDPTVNEKPYKYFVNNDESFNAFCTLGHNLSVNIGLFKTLNYNEDEIAFVLGHELAHGTHRDPANGVKKQLGLSVITGVLASQTSSIPLLLGTQVLNNVGTAKGITLPMEKRADKDAFVYCSEAGYNLGAGAAVWQKIIESTEGKKASTNVVNQLFNPSDHPGHVSRRDTYNKTINEYSNKMVKVNADTGAVCVNNKEVGVPAASDTMSVKERAYFVAGNLAAVYHADAKARPAAYAADGNVYVGTKQIMTCLDGDDAATWANNINSAYKK